MVDRHISVPGCFTGGDFSEWIQRFEICSAANEWDEDAMARKLPTLLEKEALSGFVAFAEFQARKLRPGETALLCMCVHELKRLLEDAMPNLDADSQDRILVQQLLAGLPDDCCSSRALRAIPEIKTTADAVSRARLLMTVSHQASVPTVESVNAGNDSETAAIDTLQGHVRHLTEQMSSLVDRLDGLSVAAVARPQSSDGMSIVRCFKCHRTGHISRNCRQQQTTAVGKRYRDGCKGSSTSRQFLKPQEYITAAMTDKVTIINGKLEGNDTFYPRLDYSTDPVSIHVGAVTSGRGSSSNATPSYMYVASTAGGENDEVEEIAIPNFGDEVEYDIPPAPAELRDLVKRFEVLFSTVPGSTTVAHHTIPTADHPPVRVPPRRVPAHYRTEVERQLTEMLDRNIIRVSSSPWLAPAVYVPKKSGEIKICIDYRELNKQTVKDAYPLPLPDEVQDRLSGSKVFSKLDLHSGYWQLPVKEEDCIKTAFCPGPGMEFCRMPFGVTGGPSSFQRLMDKVLHGLPFATSYIDDVLVHSPNMKCHLQHLQQVFERLANAGLTLRGSKCQLGLDKVHYLGHVFSEAGMSPDKEKIVVIKDWPIPKTVTEIRQFLGLASYYRRYIQQFVDIARPLHYLTEKTATFYPSLTKDFELQTDASAIGLGAVLEQDGHVVAYASRSLTHAERQYSVIERECLAVLYAVKQFRHYLLGRAFVLHTDHQPLQWLSAQKMEGRLCRWALALQEFDFTIKYRRGSSNANADALSRVPTIPSTCAGTVTVPELTLEDVAQEQALKANHDIISSGHQGVEKTLQRLKRTAYWIGMAKDTELCCRSCMVCQRSKLPMLTPVPMTNIPIGHPWQMLAVDVLQVPVSSRGNRYLLVIQDYFTKWAEAIPMPNQTAECIAGILIDLFSRFGIPEILHSDQGANFESTMIQRVCAAFGVLKSRTTAYHLQGDGMVERFNRTFLRCYTEQNDVDWEGNVPLVLYAYRTASNASTGFSPFVLMMGRDPVLPSLPSMTNSSAEDPTSYDSNLRVKMTELRDMVESHIVQEAKRQKEHYDTRTQSREFWEGDAVWLQNPTAGKLDPKIRRCILRKKESTLSREVEWEPASIEHFSVPADSTPQPEIVPEVPPAVLPPIDLEGQEAPPTLDQPQRRTLNVTYDLLIITKSN
eukprot:Em0111g7a